DRLLGGRFRLCLRLFSRGFIRFFLGRFFGRFRLGRLFNLSRFFDRLSLGRGFGFYRLFRGPRSLADGFWLFLRGIPGLRLRGRHRLSRGLGRLLLHFLCHFRLRHNRGFFVGLR